MPLAGSPSGVQALCSAIVVTLTLIDRLIYHSTLDASYLPDLLLERSFPVKDLGVDIEGGPGLLDVCSRTQSGSPARPRPTSPMIFAGTKAERCSAGLWMPTASSAGSLRTFSR